MIKDKEKNNFKIDVEEMTKAGLHFGHRTSKIHPKMKEYLLGVRNTIHIIDLKKTGEKLEDALEFIQKLVSEDKTLLIVGTKIQVKNLVKEMAENCELPYVSERWVGGTFTNFEEIKKRIGYFKDLERKKAQGELEKYTKKERVEIDKEIQRLKVKFEGIKNLEKPPEAVFILSMNKDDLAIREARKKGIKIVAICDTNCNPDLADFIIPANDDSISSVKYILDKVAGVIKKAKKKK